jgi:hypothetical protein
LRNRKDAIIARYCSTPWSLTLHGARLSGALLLAHVAQHERRVPASGPLQLLRASPLFHFVRRVNVWRLPWPRVARSRWSQIGAATYAIIIQSLHFEADSQLSDAGPEHKTSLPYARATDKHEEGSCHWTVGRMSGRALWQVPGARYESITRTRPVRGKHNYWHGYRNHQSHTFSDTADGCELAVL